MPQGLQLFDVPFEKPTTILAYGMKAIKRSSLTIDDYSRIAISKYGIFRNHAIAAIGSDVPLCLLNSESMAIVATGKESNLFTY